MKEKKTQNLGQWVDCRYGLQVWVYGGIDGLQVWVYGWVYSSCSLDIYEVKMGEMALWCVKPKVKTFRLGARIDISSCSLDIYEVKIFTS